MVFPWLPKHFQTTRAWCPSSPRCCVGMQLRGRRDHAAKLLSLRFLHIVSTQAPWHRHQVSHVVLLISSVLSLKFEHWGIEVSMIGERLVVDNFEIKPKTILFVVIYAHDLLRKWAICFAIFRQCILSQYWLLKSHCWLHPIISRTEHASNNCRLLHLTYVPSKSSIQQRKRACFSVFSTNQDLMRCYTSCHPGYVWKLDTAKFKG